jgi:threonine dehydrogenase-like Zn-dependent dehydrogenase
LAGVIEEAPPASPYRKGTRVGINVVNGCGVCEYCKSGYDTACPQKKMFYGNGHAEYFRAGFGCLRPLPDDVDWPAGVILSGDGLGVPARMARRLGDTRGKRVAVLGLGPIGLSIVLVQAFRGARVIGSDIVDYRLELAKNLGAEMCVNVGRASLKDAVMEATDGAGADIVAIAAGVPSLYESAVAVVKRQGVIFQVGAVSKVELPVNDVLVGKEVTLMGSWYYAREDWEDMLSYHRDGLALGALITHTMPLSEAQQAYDVFVSGQSGKVVLTY